MLETESEASYVSLNPVAAQAGPPPSSYEPCFLPPPTDTVVLLGDDEDVAASAASSAATSAAVAATSAATAVAGPAFRGGAWGHAGAGEDAGGEEVEDIELLDSAYSGFGLEADFQLLSAAYSELASEASSIEALAMDLDRAGDPEQAVACYKQAAERLSKAAAACPEGNSDRARLSQRAGQVLGRVVYLESLGGAAAVVGPEEHITDAGGWSCVDAPCSFHGASGPMGFDAQAASSSSPTWRKQAASAAAVGGAAGLLVLHAPVVAAAMAAGAAYATTRDDQAGRAARSVGSAGLVAAGRAQELAKEHHVQERMTGAVGKVQELDAQYGVTERAQAAACASWRRVQDFDQQHRVSRKVGKGLLKATVHAASATTSLAGWVAQRRAGGSSA